MAAFADVARASVAVARSPVIRRMTFSLLC
jgi:hypothetical protein